jgi:DNA-binding CsgD family transcriptional regulator
MEAKRKAVIGVILWGAAIGVALSVISALSFSTAGFSAGLAIALLVYGSLEGILISSASILLGETAPALARRRWTRVPSVFGLAFILHAAIAAGFTALRKLADKVQEEGSLKLDEAVAALCGLSARELEIADLLLAKLSYQEMAERLFISLATVKSHASSVYAKTGTARRREFVEFARNPTKSPMS